MSTSIRSISVGVIQIQTGYGVPTHIATNGSIYIDLLTSIQYINMDGVSSWTSNITGGFTLTQDEYNAITGATSPSSSNVFATINDVSASVFTGGTITGPTNFTNGLTATTVSATTYYNLPLDIYVTGGTYTNGTATFTNNTGGTFNVSGFKTDDIYVTGVTYSDNIFTFTNNTGGTFNILMNVMTGLTVNGVINSDTISATTYYNLPTDIRVTGGSYNDTSGVATFTNNTGGTFNVSGYFKTSDDIYTTGMTFNSGNYNLSITRNDGTSFTQNLGVLATDMTVTGGTYNPNTGIATFTNNSGGTFEVSGFLTGQTDTYVTGLTFNNNLLTLSQTNDEVDISILLNSFSGLTATTISATTYQGLPIDVWTTGGTYNNGSILFINNTGGTFNVSGLYTGTTDVFVTGGTYSNGIAVFTNNTGGTFNVTGFKTDDIYVTGVTYNDNVFAYTNNTGGTFNVLINTMTGLTVNGDLSTTTISATTYQNLPTDVYVTGSTYSTNVFTYTNNTGGTFNVLFNSVSALTANTLFSSIIDFNTAYTGNTTQQGRMYWDINNGTVSLGLNNDVSLQIGQESHYYIKNQSGTTITNGRVVRAAGTLGASGRILGEYMIADGTIPQKYTLGIATEDIPNGSDGYVTEFGLVRGIDTTGSLYGETWNDGDILWVSPTFYGGLTNVQPQSPNLKIEVAIVIHASANGSIFVRPHRYPHLHDLQEVVYSANTEQNLDLLQWSDDDNGFILTSTPKVNSISATTISATTYYGDGSNLTGISTQDTYVTGVTVDNNIVSFNRNDVMSAYTVSFSGVNIDIISDDINKKLTFSASTGGGGEVNTASNLGGGTGIFAQKSGVDLQFKSLTSTGGTITISTGTTTVNLSTNIGVKPIPIATSNIAIGTGSNDYYLNFLVPYDLTIVSATWTASSTGSDAVRYAIYRGQDTTATLVGQTAGATLGGTITTRTITAESGQNLSFKAGEWMVIGVAVGGTTTNLYGMSCPSNNAIAWFNTTDSASAGFPTNPRSKTGTRTSFPSIELNVV